MIQKENVIRILKAIQEYIDDPVDHPKNTIWMRVQDYIDSIEKTMETEEGAQASSFIFLTLKQPPGSSN